MRNKDYHYMQQTRYEREQGTSKFLRDNPVVTSPGYLISRDLNDIGEKLVDFLPKMSQHFSVKGSRPLPDPSARLLQYSTTEANKLFSVILIAHDIETERKIRYRDFIKEELNASSVELSPNLIVINWDNGTTNLMGVAELIYYMGAPELCEKEII